jgi:hypothetical protein
MTEISDPAAVEMTAEEMTSGRITYDKTNCTLVIATARVIFRVFAVVHPHLLL